MADPSIKDLAYRGLAATLGGPVDLATMVMRPFGYKVPEQQVVGGSEWIGKKMEDVGLVSTARAPLQEFAASMIVPSPDDLYRAAAMAPALIGSTKAVGKMDDVLRTVNPTGSVFVEYTPSVRATQPLAQNIVTLDKTLGGNPDDLITIYRGAPKQQKQINPGDFVTDNLQLAKDYAGNGHVLKMRVKKSQVIDDIEEPGMSEYIFRP